MDIIPMPRRRGKTTMLIRWALQDPATRIIVVFTDQERENIESMLHREFELNRDSVRVITIYELINPRLAGGHFPHNVELAFDNVEALIPHLLKKSGSFIHSAKMIATATPSMFVEEPDGTISIGRGVTQ